MGMFGLPMVPLLQGGQFLSGLFGMFDQQRLDSEARAANEKRYNQLLREIGGYGQRGGLYGRVMPEVKRLSQQAISTGEAQKSELNRYYRDLQSASQQDAISRGMAGSTALAGTTGAIGTERNRAMGNLEEQLKASNFQYGMMPTNYDIDLTSQRAGIIERRSDIPGQSPLLGLSQLFGSMIPAPKPDTPSQGGLIAGELGGAAIGTGGLITAASIKAASLWCIDGAALLIRPGGNMTPLAYIAVGDLVLNEDGDFRAVIDKDYGMPHYDRLGDFIKIRDVANKRSLICTKDHIIETTAGTVAEPHWAVPCGDIRLEDDSAYIANGFVVESMITHVRRQD